MSFFSKFQSVAGGLLKYGALATAAVAQVQTEIGASGGDTNTQQSKKQLAVTYILAAAHAGESVPLPQVQMIAAVVDFVASTAKALGLFGKVPAASHVVPVPPAGA